MQENCNSAKIIPNQIYVKTMADMQDSHRYVIMQHKYMYVDMQDKCVSNVKNIKYRQHVTFHHATFYLFMSTCNLFILTCIFVMLTCEKKNVLKCQPFTMVTYFCHIVCIMLFSKNKLTCEINC